LVTRKARPHRWIRRENGKKRDNHRNGTSKKTLLSKEGKLEIEIPQDRTGEFDPQFVRKGQRRFGGFDQKIIAMYAQGMMVREIQRFLEEQYKVGSRPDLISTLPTRSWRMSSSGKIGRWCWSSLTP